MNDLLETIVILLITGIIGFLCSFLCVLSSFKKELWETIKERDENGRN